jgi:hypothetical protein
MARRAAKKTTITENAEYAEVDPRQHPFEPNWTYGMPSRCRTCDKPRSAHTGRTRKTKPKGGIIPTPLVSKECLAVATNAVGIACWTIRPLNSPPWVDERESQIRTEDAVKRAYLEGHLGVRWEDLVKGLGARIVRVRVSPVGGFYTPVKR